MTHKGDPVSDRLVRLGQCLLASLRLADDTAASLEVYRRNVNSRSPIIETDAVARVSFRPDGI